MEIGDKRRERERRAPPARMGDTQQHCRPGITSKSRLYLRSALFYLSISVYIATGCAALRALATLGFCVADGYMAWTFE